MAKLNYKSALLWRTHTCIILIKLSFSILLNCLNQKTRLSCLHLCQCQLTSILVSNMQDKYNICNTCTTNPGENRASVETVRGILNTLTKHFNISIPLYFHKLLANSSAEERHGPISCNLQLLLYTLCSWYTI